MNKLLPALLACLFLTVNASSMYCYKAVTAGEKFVFFMKSNQRCFLDDQYPENGMYANDGSKIPLWTVDWNDSAILPSDGRHVVRTGDRKAFEITRETEGLRFYEDGKLVKSWKFRELTTFSFLEMGSGPFHGGAVLLRANRRPVSTEEGAGYVEVEFGDKFPMKSGEYFNEAEGTLSVTNNLGDEFTFDYRTGEMLSSRRPTMWFAGWLSVAIFLLWMGVVAAQSRNDSGPALRVFCAALMAFVFTLLFMLVPLATFVMFSSEAGSVSGFEYGVRDLVFMTEKSSMLLARSFAVDLGLATPWADYADLDRNWFQYGLLFFWLPIATLISVATYQFGKRLRRFFA